MVNVTIDGKAIQVPDGTTVLNAAREAGIKIATLCDHPELSPYGGCRLCVVEVEGARTLQPSCTLPVNNNMVVHTDTEKVHEARKFVLTLIFSERNHFCMYCQVSGGDCELQNAAYAEGMTHWALSPNYQPYAMDASHPYFVLDNNRCILCRRCVRACGELVGNYTLGFEERGARSFLVADLGTPLGESTCISCGNCLQVCPTGALIDRQSAYHGREIQVDHTKTICVGCSLGCGLEVLSRDNHLVRVDGDWEAMLNEGLLCKVGRFYPIAEERERLTTPLVRKNGTLKAATWEEAFDQLASQLKPGTGVSAIASTRLPVESLSLFKQIFTEQLHSGMVTSLEEGSATAAASAAAHETGKPFEASLDALKQADLVLTIGADLAADHEVASFFIKRALPNGTRLVSIDPQGTALDDMAEIVLKPTKGSLPTLFYGMATALVELGSVKAQPGFDTSHYDPAAVSKQTGLTDKMILDTASLFSSAQKPVIVIGEGLLSQGAAAVKAVIELAQLAGAAVINLKGKANSLAASLLGLEQPFKLDGHKAVYLAVGDDTVSQSLLKRLEGVPFLAVQAAYVSPLTARADVVLPVEMWAEQEGTFINSSGKVQVSKKVLAPAEGIRSNQAVLLDLAKCLGAKVDRDWQSQLTLNTSPVLINSFE
jgi:formate dehydrogenase major subunit